MINPPPICVLCKHYDREESSCRAFPRGIPAEITQELNDHMEPLAGEYPTFEQGDDVEDSQMEAWQNLRLVWTKAQTHVDLDLPAATGPISGS